MKNFTEVIIRPLLTEKSNVLSELQNKYVFQVFKNANKIYYKEYTLSFYLMIPYLLWSSYAFVLNVNILKRVKSILIISGKGRGLHILYT